MAAADVAVPVPLDRELIERVAQGDVEAFDTLYERYFPRVVRFVRKRVSNQADAEETVQEVFINFFSSLHSYRGEAPLAAWVFGLTRRTLANRYKRRRAETVPLPEDEQFLALDLARTSRTDGDPHAAYEYGERLGRLQDAAERLSSDQWQLFKLHHLENRSIEEIAGTVRKSEDAVKSHLYRARKLLLAR
jgi:RNA polymerase sigma-70 factor (ECF subfamily)